MENFFLKKRVGYLDALKCLGIILVIEGHVRQLGIGIEVYDTIPGLMFYSFNMPIFFFVSGMLAYKGNMTIPNIITNVWRKILVLIIPATIFKVLYDMASHHDPLDVIYMGFGKYWFTITLFECFFLYYLSHIIFKVESMRHIFLLLLSIVGVGLLSARPMFGPGIIDMNHLTKYFQFFVFGILSMRYKTLYEDVMRNEVVKTIVLLSFFSLLFLLDYPIWSKYTFHFMRDIILRYLGTIMVVSFFVCHAPWFDQQSKVNNIIMNIGQKSLAIYLLQYFFLPDIKIFDWKNNLDLCTIHIISLLYTIVILAACLMLIAFISNSFYVKKYCLGQK